MVEGNMCGTVNARRGRSAGVGDHNHAREGWRRNLGGLMAIRDRLWAVFGSCREARVGASRRCTGCEESDGCIVPLKLPNKAERWRREWREGARSRGTRMAKRPPDTAPDGMRQVRHHAWAAGDRRGNSPEVPSRLTRDRSPVRESRTPGSARGERGNPPPYRDCPCVA